MPLILSAALNARIKRIHFIGIGGIGMSGIAEILCRLGYGVSGSDAQANYNTKRLEALGADVAVGHDAAHVKGADIVVYSSAIPSSNPEMRAAREDGIPVVARAEMLAELMRFRHAAAIAGSHGKTTTTSVVAALFEAAGMDPTVINGGVINRHGTNAYLGKGEWLVAEADESDGSFLRLPATVAVVTNIDPEHMDHYGSFESLVAAFRKFVEGLPFYGFAVMCVDHPVVRQLTKEIASRRIVTYGFSEDADVRAENIVLDGMGSRFDVIAGGELWMEGAAFSCPGKHNVQNCLAALAIARELGIDRARIAEGLKGFKGVKRRFTVLGASPEGVTVVDDYAHHPEEIKATLATAVAVAKGENGEKGRVIAVFEPHRYSRVQHLAEEFAECFRDADLVLVKEICAAGEAPVEGVTREALVSGVASRHPGVVKGVWRDEDVIAFVRKEGRPGDLVLCMGAGPITAFAKRLYEEMAA
jgi:UDP-N-acetylmuramate--alanine ligase